MKYYPRLKIWKSGPNNTFDGTEAVSYGWYVYAIKLNNGKFVGVEGYYSQATCGHINRFQKQFMDNKPFDYVVVAPHGLGALDGAMRAIVYKINLLKIELENPKPRALKARRDRIAQLESMLKTLYIIDADPTKSHLNRR